MLYILSVKNSITIKSDKLQIQLYFLPVNNFKLLYKRNSLFENFFPSFLRKEILFFVFFYILKKRLFFIYVLYNVHVLNFLKKKEERKGYESFNGYNMYVVSRYHNYFNYTATPTIYHYGPWIIYFGNSIVRYCYLL